MPANVLADKNRTIIKLACSKNLVTKKVTRQNQQKKVAIIPSLEPRCWL